MLLMNMKNVLLTTFLKIVAVLAKSFESADSGCETLLYCIK